MHSKYIERAQFFFNEADGLSIQLPLDFTTTFGEYSKLFAPLAELYNTISGIHIFEAGSLIRMKKF